MEHARSDSHAMKNGDEPCLNRGYIEVNCLGAGIIGPRSRVECIQDIRVKLGAMSACARLRVNIYKHFAALSSFLLDLSVSH